MSQLVTPVYFPGGTSSQQLTGPRRVSFASSVTVLGDAPPLVHSPDISVQEPPCHTLSHEEWKVGGDPSLFMFTMELPGWFPWSSGGLPGDLPSLPLSPIDPDNLDDSVTANMGSSKEDSYTPSEVVVIKPPVGAFFRM